ncbi:MAG: AmmeMemoRadiSam system protein B [Bacillariaceae sp.]|jgi:AmmeMemoRadiSam system protein B
MGNASVNKNNKMNNNYNRRAHHAGSWYSDDEKILDENLHRYLMSAAKEEMYKQNNIRHSSLRAIICPHAGFDYSGPTAAYGYHHLERELSKKDTPIRHILVFHPSHHFYLDGCAVSGATKIETPLGNLPVDTLLREEILNLKPGAFTIMNRNVDESEHSGEMQYPYIAKVQNDANKKKGTTNKIPVLPIMCGSLSNSKESTYGKLLAEIVSRSDVLSILSSDFCHWGDRFNYQPTPRDNNEKIAQKENTATDIFEFIRDLDNRGMEHISMQQPGAFAQYLKETRNTICGRHAIQTWLNAVVHSKSDSKNTSNDGEDLSLEFIKYAQSSEVRSMRESSVSYASAVARVFQT